jgi:hypothetical protein
VAPQTFEELDEVYNLDIGSLYIDLTDLPWEGEVIDLEVNVDAGNVEIEIPDGVGVVGEASVDVGRVGANGRESAGLGNPELQFNDPGRLGTVTLDASVDIGNIDIYRR